MQPTIALNTADIGSIKFARSVVAARDGPVYLVGKQARDGLHAIPVFARAAPSAALLAQVPAMVLQVLQDADALPGPKPTTFLEALARIFQAAKLEISTDVLVSVPTHGASASRADASGKRAPRTKKSVEEK
jgi:hypothetical protein